MTSQTHLTTQELASFRRRTLAPEQLLRVSEHLGQCRSCNREYRVEGPVPAMPQIVAECDERLHLSYEQISAYLDAKPETPAWVVVEQHIAFCRPCAAEVRDLAAFEARVAKVEVPPVETKAGLLATIAGFFRMPQSPSFAAAAVAMMAVGAILVVSDPATGSNVPVAGAHVDTYFSQHPLNAQLLSGAFLLLTGASALLYRFTRKNPKQ